MQKINEYRVRSGCTFGKSRQYGPGSIVQLTEREASGFLDKLELFDPLLVDDSPDPEPELVEIPASETPVVIPEAEVIIDNDEPIVEADFIPLAISSLSVKKVIEAVKEGRLTAEEALASEKAGLERKSLIAKLERMIANG